MAASIKLMRLGKKNMPYYRIVAIDKRKKRNSRYIEVIGHYNPIKEPTLLEIDWDKLNAWKQKGAEFSEGLTRLLKSQKVPKTG